MKLDLTLIGIEMKFNGQSIKLFLDLLC